MAIKQVAVPDGRARIIHTGLTEEIVIPARRNWFALSFLPIWLALWSLGGIVAVYALFTEFQLFLLVWLCGWALGWLYAASTIAWQLFGEETIRVEAGKLIHSCRAPLWNRELAYDVAQIRGLSPDRGPSFFEGAQFPTPLLTYGRIGVIKFHYGAKTIHMASSLDEAEGRQLVDWLAARLPLSAGQ